MSIESVNITKEYVRRGKTFRAVDEVSISVPKGKITVVTGNSGSGKRTLLNILAGMTVPEGGTVRIDDTELLSLKSRERDKLRGKKFSAFACQSGNGAEKALAKLKKMLGTDDLEAELILIDPLEKPDPGKDQAIAGFCEKLR